MSRRASAGSVAAIRCGDRRSADSRDVAADGRRPPGAQRRGRSTRARAAPGRPGDRGKAVRGASSPAPGLSGGGPHLGRCRRGRAIGRRSGRAGSPPVRGPRPIGRPACGDASSSSRRNVGRGRRPQPIEQVQGGDRRHVRLVDRVEDLEGLPGVALEPGEGQGREQARLGHDDLVLDHLDDPVGVDQGGDLRILAALRHVQDARRGSSGPRRAGSGRSRAPRRE